jgi:hypothetical protein
MKRVSNTDMELCREKMNTIFNANAIQIRISKLTDISITSKEKNILNGYKAILSLIPQKAIFYSI